MEEKQELPDVQYALFCREVIEDENEITFKNVLHAIFLPRPADITITLVMKLINVPKGRHNIHINCVIPPIQLLQWDFDIELQRRRDCFITEKLRQIPVSTSNIYRFAILYDGNPIKKLKLPIKLITDLPTTSQ